MDAQTFIKQNSEQQMSEFHAAYGCTSSNHNISKLSESVAVKEKGLKIFFDKIRYKVILGKTKDALIDTLKNDRFPVAPVNDLMENCIEVDSVVSVSWYGNTKVSMIGITLEYIVKDNEVISHIAHLD
jgi:hypothetical protein